MSPPPFSPMATALAGKSSRLRANAVSRMISLHVRFRRFFVAIVKYRKQAPNINFGDHRAAVLTAHPHNVPERELPAQLSLRPFYERDVERIRHAILNLNGPIIPAQRTSPPSN
jgi:hypothetical protein